mgnify:CR=1 FL=1
MGYTIRNFIESNKFPGIQLVSNNSGVNKEIKGVRSITVPNMENFLGGGELLLTSLTVYEKLNEHMLLNHLEELNKKQVSGFVVKRRQNTMHQNKVFETLLCFCNKHSIPVLELPQSVSFWQVIKYVLSRTQSIEIAKFIYSKMTRDEINRFFSEGAIAENTMEKMLDKVERILGNPMTLYDENLCKVYPSSSAACDLIILDDSEKYVPNILTQYEYIRQKRNYVEYIKKINILDQCDFYLVISEVNEPLTELDFITLENVISAILYVLTQAVTVRNIEKKYHRDLEYRMLNGSLSEAEEDDVANLLNLNVVDEYRVITCYLKPENNKDNFNSAQRKETEIVEKAVLDFVPKEYVYCNTNRIIYIHKENRNDGKQDLRKKLEKFQKLIQNRLNERNSKYEFLIGIGKCVKGYHNLKDSFEDSKIAIEYIDVIRKIIGDVDKSVVECSKLGFFHIFANIKDEKQLRTYIPDAVNEIYQYDTKKNGELVNTLECYLDHKQSVRKTSELMCVHPRTVSYRLKKIVELTGMDYDNIAEMLAVRNGIILLKILEQL